MGHRNPRATRLHMWVFKDLSNRVDGAARHANGFKTLDPFGRCPGHGNFTHRRNERGAIDDASGTRRIARVRRPLGMPGGCAELCKLPVIADGQNNIAVCGWKVLIGHDIGMSITHPFRRNTGIEVIHRLVCEARNLHVEKREIDLLTNPADVAMRKCCEYRG